METTTKELRPHYSDMSHAVRCYIENPDPNSISADRSKLYRAMEIITMVACRINKINDTEDDKVLETAEESIKKAKGDDSD